MKLLLQLAAKPKLFSFSPVFSPKHSFADGRLTL